MGKDMPGICTECGHAIPDGSPSGICPRCCFAAFPARNDELIEGIEIGELLGEGSFGEVFAGTQLDFSLREVAVKIMRQPGLERQRFLDEMQIVALLKHPNIAQLHASGTTRDGRLYYTMELVDGVGFGQESSDALTTMIQLASALAHAHQQGVIHRDLKPSNVLMMEDGTVKVIDFGIARVVSGPLAVSRGLTQGMRLGTPLYMSPEQIEGDPRIDALTDVHALGLLFYERVLGRPVLEGVVSPEDSWAVNLHRLEDFDFPTLSPCEFDWVARKACAFEREDRYQSVDALLTDLRSIQRGTMVSAGQKSRAYRARRALRKYRTFVTIVGLVILVLAVLAGMGMRMAARDRKAAREIGRVMDQLRAAEAATKVKDSRARLREANFALGRDDAVRALAAVDRALELHPGNDEAIYFKNFLRATRSFATPLPPPDLRLQAVDVAAHPDGFVVRSLDGDEQIVRLESRGLSRRFRDVAVHDDPGGILTFTSRETGEPMLSPLNYGSGTERAAVSPERGMAAATTPDGGLRLWDLSDLRPPFATTRFPRQITWLNFERESDCLWLMDEEAFLHRWSEKGNTFEFSRTNGFGQSFFDRHSLEDRGDYLWTFWLGGNQRGLAGGKAAALVGLLAVDWHTRSRGTSIMISAVARDRDTVLFIDSAGDIGVRNERGTYDFLPGPPAPVRRVALTGNGELGAVLLESGELATFSTTSRKYLHRWKPAAPLTSLILLDRGKLLVAGDRLGGIHFFDPSNGEVKRSAIDTRSPGLELAAVPHREEFLTRSDGELHIKRWDARSGRLLHSGMRHQDGVLWFSCSLDGKFLFSIDQESDSPTRGSLRVWSLLGGEEIVPALTHDSPLNCATIYENGRRIATAAADGSVRRWSIPRE
jgi:hypothetical protein